MLIFENERLEIHDVGTNSKSDPSLTEVEVADGTFDGWSNAKICCYKAQVTNGHVVMLTPYVDSRLIEHIDQLGVQGDHNTEENVVTTETVDSIMTDMLPEFAATDESIIATIDSILTDIIPSLVDE